MHFFSGTKTILPGETPEEATEHFEGLSSKKLKCLGSFKLESDDSKNYTDKLTFLEQRRDLSGKYPKGSDPDENSGFLVKGGKVVSKPGDAVSIFSAEESYPIDPATLQLKQDLVKWHFEVVKMCQKIGIPDVCQTYKETRLENILDGLSGKDLTCKLCKKQCYNTQKLKEHIKGKHLKKTDHYCEPCKKYFSTSTALNVHNDNKHNEEASKFGCSQCKKLFLTKEQLDKHMNVHRGKQYSCQFCNQLFGHSQGLKEHEEKTCKSRPGYDPKDTTGWYTCRICSKKIKHHRSYLRHLREKHNGAPEFV